MRPHIQQTIADLELEQQKLSEMIDRLRAIDGIPRPLVLDAAPAGPVLLLGRGRRSKKTAALPSPRSPRRTAEPDVAPLAPAAAQADDNLSALSEAGVRIGLALPETFTTADLVVALSEAGNKKPRKAYDFVHYWKKKEWLESEKSGSYRKTPAFGK